MLFDQGLMSRVISAIQNARGKKIKDKDWIIILEDTKDCLKPYLSTFACTILGHVRLFGGETIETDLAGVEYDTKNLPLSTHGFWHDERGCTIRPNNLVFWGITRKGEWAFVSLMIQALRGKNSNGEEFYKEKAISLQSARICTIKEIVAETGYTYANIFDSLYIDIDSWASRREDLAKEAVKFRQGIKGIREILFDFI